MTMAEGRFSRIQRCLPTQRGDVKISNLDVLNAILCVTQQGCKWRAIPKRFGRWNKVPMRTSRWAKAGVPDRVVTALQQADIIRIRWRHLDWIARPSTPTRRPPLWQT